MHSLKPPDHILIKIYSFLFSSTFEHHSGPQKHTRKTIKKRMSKWSAWIAQATPVFKKCSLQTYSKRPPQKNHQIRKKVQKQQENVKRNGPRGNISDPKRTSIWSPVWTSRNQRYMKTGSPRGLQNEAKKEGQNDVKNRSKNGTQNLQVWSHLDFSTAGEKAFPLSPQSTPIYFKIFQDFRLAWNIRVQPPEAPVRWLAARLAGTNNFRKRSIRCNQNLY